MVQCAYFVQDWQSADSHQARNQRSHLGANRLRLYLRVQNTNQELSSQPGQLTCYAQKWARVAKSFPAQNGHHLFLHESRRCVCAGYAQVTLS